MFWVRVSTHTRMGVGFTGMGAGWTLLTCAVPMCHPSCKCLHLTLMNKACSMSIACAAPPFLWDEFVSTASYLSTLTPSSSLHGCTPFKFWFGCRPNLSHLREIGCSVYVLYEHSSKINPHSFLCKLIGYKP